MNKEYRVLSIIGIIGMINILAGCSLVQTNPSTISSSVYINAEKAYSRKQFSLAKKYYLELLSQKPVNINVLFRLGNIYVKESHWKKAIGYYSEVLKSQPGHEKTHYNLAMLHLSRAHEHMSYYIKHYPSENSQSMKKLVGAIGEYSLTSNDTTHSPAQQ